MRAALAKSRRSVALRACLRPHPQFGQFADNRRHAPLSSARTQARAWSGPIPRRLSRLWMRSSRQERLDAGQGLPSYMRDHAVYYAGPAKTPEGYASGSFGPTTAGRMDSYVAEFQARGAHAKELLAATPAACLARAALVSAC
eukprot:5569279-Pleurochrysis_carterae.AAC.1